MDVEDIGDVHVVVMVPRLDALTAKDVETELTELVAEGNEKLLCDMSQTTYISSTGLRVLLLVAKALQQKGGKLALCDMGSSVREIFEISGLIAIFKVVESRTEALAWLAQ